MCATLWVLTSTAYGRSWQHSLWGEKCLGMHTRSLLQARSLPSILVMCTIQHITHSIAPQWCTQCNRLHMSFRTHRHPWHCNAHAAINKREHMSFQTELLGSLDSIGWGDTHLGLWMMDEKKMTLVAASKKLTNELCYVICWWHKIESSCTQLIGVLCSHIILHWDLLQIDHN